MDGHITCVEFAGKSSGEGCLLARLLSCNVPKDDVSEGAELWKTNP
jgi:hypothetical protein